MLRECVGLYIPAFVLPFITLDLASSFRDQTRHTVQISSMLAWPVKAAYNGGAWTTLHSRWQGLSIGLSYCIVVLARSFMLLVIAPTYIFNFLFATHIWVATSWFRIDVVQRRIFQLLAQRHSLQNATQPLRCTHSMHLLIFLVMWTERLTKCPRPLKVLLKRGAALYFRHLHYNPASPTVVLALSQGEARLVLFHGDSRLISRPPFLQSHDAYVGVCVWRKRTVRFGKLRRFHICI
jgi:hypothetical protein